MMGDDFFVTDAEPPFATSPEHAPAAVVMAPTVWTDASISAVRRRWPSAPLVLIDPPAEMASANPTAAVGSWSDPLALPSLLTDVAGASAPLGGACAAVARLVEGSVGRDLRVSRILSSLVLASEDPHSVRLGVRFLRERMLSVLETLGWVDAEPSLSRIDLVDALRVEFRRDDATLRRRRLRVEFRGLSRFPMAPSAEPRRIAAALAAHLRRLPSGVIEISSQGTTLACAHPDLLANESLPLLVAIRGLQRSGAAVRVADGVLYATSAEG